MEIKIEPGVSFYMPQEELRRMYIYLALATYPYLRKPNYNETVLLRQLSIDLKKFLLESQTLAAQMPNNHNLNRILQYFDFQHKHLKEIVDKIPKDER